MLSECLLCSRVHQYALCIIWRCKHGEKCFVEPIRTDLFTMAPRPIEVYGFGWAGSIG